MATVREELRDGSWSCPEHKIFVEGLTRTEATRQYVKHMWDFHKILITETTVGTDEEGNPVVVPGVPEASAPPQTPEVIISMTLAEFERLTGYKVTVAISPATRTTEITAATVEPAP